MAPPPPGPTGDDWGRRNHEFWQVDKFAFLKALAEDYGDIVSFDLGRSRCILVNGAPEVRELFFEREACLRKPEFVKDSNRGHWGDGLTTLEGSAWRGRRRELVPLFGPGKIMPWLSVVAECTADMLDTWTPDTEIDLPRELRILTARIAVRAVLDAGLEGYDSGAGRAGIVPFEEAYGEDYASKPGGDPTAPLVMVRPRAPRRMDAVARIIDERIASGERRGDILSDLVHGSLAGGQKIPCDEIMTEIVQMLYAGHLTIPFVMVNFWRDIAVHKANVAVSAEAEGLATMATPDMAAPDLAAPDLAVLSSSYCMAALKESMRLHPPAPILYREVESSFELGGFEFVRDTAVWVSSHLLHRDARYFAEPERFLPERFAKDNPMPALRTAYLPFGAGRRICIASELALHQMTLIALLTARRFRLIPTSLQSKYLIGRLQRGAAG